MPKFTPFQNSSKIHKYPIKYRYQGLPLNEQCLWLARPFRMIHKYCKSLDCPPLLWADFLNVCTSFEKDACRPDDIQKHCTEHGSHSPAMFWIFLSAVACREYRKKQGRAWFISGIQKGNRPSPLQWPLPMPVSETENNACNRFPPLLSDLKRSWRWSAHIRQSSASSVLSWDNIPLCLDEGQSPL